MPVKGECPLKVSSEGGVTVRVKIRLISTGIYTYPFIYIFHKFVQILKVLKCIRKLKITTHCQHDVIC